MKKEDEETLREMPALFSSGGSMVPMSSSMNPSPHGAGAVERSLSLPSHLHLVSHSLPPFHSPLHPQAAVGSYLQGAGPSTATATNATTFSSSAAAAVHLQDPTSHLSNTLRSPPLPLHLSPSSLAAPAAAPCAEATGNAAP